MIDRYVKKLPPKMIVQDGVEHFYCSIKQHYSPYEKMQKDRNSLYGVKRICRECYRNTYGYVPVENRRARRTGEQKLLDEIEYKKNDHINLWGLTQAEVEEVKEVMKRMGFTNDEPVWVQWHKKHGFPI